MAELLVVRHGQASFGAANYDQLSDLGRAQAERLGALLRARGWAPQRLITGTLQRQRDTLRYLSLTGECETHAGFNEYDFHDLLAARFRGSIPADVMQDRRTHFRTLRETVLMWQQGGLPGARESWPAFCARVEDGRQFALRGDAQRVLVVSSGGVIGQMVAACVQAPAAQMMHLNLQVRNTALTRFIFSRDRFYLHEFNAVPHFSDAEGAAMASYA